MKRIGYILKTKNYYLTCLILTILYLIISFSFSNYWMRTSETLKTFNQCSASIIAYDTIADTKDSFANYERNVRVALREEDGESFNVFAYQFLENTRYSDKTIINSKNVIFGDFKVLETNEIAIPNSIAKQYHLQVGDRVFVAGKKCELKFIFRDVYQIYEVNYSISQTIVLLGINTIENDIEIVNYCNFDPAETMHQQLRNLNPIRNKLVVQRMVYFINISLIIAICSLIVMLFRRKEEIRSFRNYRFSGGKLIIVKLLLIELIYIIPCLLLFYGLGMLMSISITLLIIICIIAIVSWSINLCVLSSRIMR